MYASYNNVYNSFLEHSGKKGMKWGIRNSVKKLKNRIKNPHYSKDYKQTKNLRRKSSKYLSNNQLRELNKRMELEQNYNRLSTTPLNRGFTIARNIIAISGTIAGLYAMRNKRFVKDGVNLVNGIISKNGK